MTDYPCDVARVTGEEKNMECDYCDKQAAETVRYRGHKHQACATCAAVVRAAEHTRKALRGRK